MKYVIDEEELWDLLKNTQYDSIAYTIKYFLESKTPVNEIDDEKVRQAINWVEKLNPIVKYKIYIEVIK